MGLFSSESRIVQKIFEGDDLAFASLYEKYRDKFFAFFNGQCVEETIFNQRMTRFKSDSLYLDDLYQTSCLKLYNQIMTGKMFVSNSNIYILGSDGSVNPLAAKLGTYLISIGRLTLKELERNERRYVDFDPIQRMSGSDDLNDPQYDDNFGAKVNQSDVEIAPGIELSSDPFFDDEDRASVVRRIVENMESPCKEIFTLTYFSKEGKKMKGEEIAKRLKYASADVVKNQKSRCHKKFKARYSEEMQSIR